MASIQPLEQLELESGQAKSGIQTQKAQVKMDEREGSRPRWIILVIAFVVIITALILGFVFNSRAEHSSAPGSSGQVYITKIPGHRPLKGRRV